MTDEKMIKTVHQIVNLLVQGDYDSLERMTKSRRLNAADLSKCVREYRRTLAMPPKEAFQNLDVVEIEDSSLKEWDVRVSMWTLEEGRSDLTLELTLTDSDEDLYDFQIDNLHVL
jgi:hypothetical protein